MFITPNLIAHILISILPHFVTEYNEWDKSSNILNETKFNILSHSEMEALCVLDTITANKTVQIQAADERRSKIHG